MRQFLAFVLLFFGCMLSADVSPYLLPTPKKMNFRGRVTLPEKTFKLDNRFGKTVNKKQLDLFSSTLTSRLGWQQKADSSFAVSLIRKPLSPQGKEYYELEISAAGIKISAGSSEGIMRGLSRLLAMTLTPLFEATEKGLVLPAISIKDYPDNPQRIFQVNLRQVYAHTPPKLMLETALLLIDRAAEMQFNCVMLMIGGSMKLEGHPEINPPGPVWSKEQIKLLVERAHLRGLEAGPLINSIGHAAAGPYIAPIYDKSGKKVIGTNVMDPKFDKLFFRYIDELADLFPGAKYFGIGTDEFHRVMKEIEKLSGKKCEEYYPEYVNKVSRHLKKRGMRTMIYHDMMGPGGRYKWPIETLNGPAGAMEMLKKFDKDVIVSYWNYFHAYDYPFVKDLKEAGFKTIWFTGWYGEHCLGALFRAGHKMNAPLFTTHWSAIPAKNEFVHGSEFSWNINSKRTQDDFNDINNLFFYGRNAGHLQSSDLEIVPLQGGIPLFADYRQKLLKRFGKTQIAAYGIPLDFSGAKSFSNIRELPRCNWSQAAELHKKGVLKNYTFHTPQTIVQRVIGSKSGVNETREKQKVIIYTSDFGPRTKTNNRGVEFAIDKTGKVLTLSGNCIGKSGDEKGNMAIPAEGFVISWHEAQPCFFYRGNTFYQTLRKGDTLYLTKRSTRAMTRKIITGSLSKPRQGAVVYLGAVRPLEPGRLLKISFHLENGKKHDVIINGNDFIAAPNILLNNPAWKSYLPFSMVKHGLFPILAIERQQRKGQPKISKVTLQATTAALESGTSVLGVTAFDTASERGKK